MFSIFLQYTLRFGFGLGGCLGVGVLVLVVFQLAVEFPLLVLS